MKKQGADHARIKQYRRITGAFILATLAILFVSLDAWFSIIRGDDSVSIEIPNLCGMQEGELVAQSYLEWSLHYQYDDQVPKGVVISQEPVAGSRRKLGEDETKIKLELIVSLGVDRKELPNVVGMDLREAAALLRGAGFSVHTATCESDEPDGTVLSMTPQGGSTLEKGGRVTLTVSTSYPSGTVEMPNVVGLSRSDALITLWMSGLSVKEVNEEVHESAGGTVIAQSHRPGTTVLAGTKITLTVSREKNDSNS